jgi:hypothetical protein
MTAIAHNVFKYLLLLNLLASYAFAQSCVDSDNTTAGGNNPFSRGQVTVVSSSGVTTQHVDTCDASGISLREFFCTSAKTVASVVHQGTYGCLDGALVKEGGTTPACFTDITLAITPTDTAETLSVLSAVREIDRLWWTTARTAPLANDSTVMVTIRNGAGQTIATRYSTIVPEYFDAPSTRAISRVTLPFYPTARSLLFKVGDTVLTYTIPAPLLTCSRARIPLWLSGIEGRDSCITGGQKLMVNNTTFTCIPSASPSPSPSAAPVL